MTHKWSRDGETCLRCGSKDWLADAECTPKKWTPPKQCKSCGGNCGGGYNGKPCQHDPTPWCLHCGPKSACDCGPIAEND